MTDGISPKQFRESEGVGDWRVLGEGANVVLGYAPRRDSPVAVD